VKGALRVAALLHLGMLAALVGLALLLDLGPVFRGTLAAVALLLVHEHRLVRPDDLSRVNRAFFHWNAVISLALGLAMVVEALRLGEGS
jgi:4-hydroxybenzoate polyprenyltransferase